MEPIALSASSSERPPTLATSWVEVLSAMSAPLLSVLGPRLDSGPASRAAPPRPWCGADSSRAGSFHLSEPVHRSRSTGRARERSARRCPQPSRSVCFRLCRSTRVDRPSTPSSAGATTRQKTSARHGGPSRLPLQVHRRQRDHSTVFSGTPPLRGPPEQPRTRSRQPEMWTLSHWRQKDPPLVDADSKRRNSRAVQPRSDRRITRGSFERPALKRLSRAIE
jgi:hypothetical protein